VLADGKTGDLPSRLAEIVQRAPAERSRFTTEITKLKELLEASRIAEMKMAEKLRSVAGDEALSDIRCADVIGSDVSYYSWSLSGRRLNSHLLQEQNPIPDLRASLADQSAELYSLKKKLNRDIPINNSPHESLKVLNGSPVSSKHDLAALRDEIIGLKYVFNFYTCALPFTSLS
jgi:hypothetical protein